jgi:ferredoxin
MTICYFTATGNSLYVARRLGGELKSIPQLMRETSIRIRDDAVGIVCPVYCGEMPKMVRAFLEKANIETEYFFFVYTYGMAETVARPNAELAARKAGLKLNYSAAIRMVDNYLPGFEMQNQIETEGEKKIEAQIEQVCREVAERHESTVKLTPFKRAEIALVHNSMGRAILKGSAAHSYVVSDDCIRCGVCAMVCPANNITVTDRVRFSDHCEVCYACVHNCPKNAIHLKNERSAARFRNEHVELKDIVSANE